MAISNAVEHRPQVSFAPTHLVHVYARDPKKIRSSLFYTRSEIKKFRAEAQQKWREDEIARRQRRIHGRRLLAQQQSIVLRPASPTKKQTRETPEHEQSLNNEQRDEVSGNTLSAPSSLSRRQRRNDPVVTSPTSSSSSSSTLLSPNRRRLNVRSSSCPQLMNSRNSKPSHKLSGNRPSMLKRRSGSSSSFIGTSNNKAMPSNEVCRRQQLQQSPSKRSSNEGATNRSSKRLSLDKRTRKAFIKAFRRQGQANF